MFPLEGEINITATTLYRDSQYEYHKSLTQAKLLLPQIESVCLNRWVLVVH